jgi:membrane protein implicated in regulation of membrane protease activity
MRRTRRGRDRRVTHLLDDYAWIGWLAVVLVLIVVEMRRLDLRGLLGGAAALAALLVGLVGAAWWLQAAVGAVAAVVLLRVARPALLRALPVDGPDADETTAGAPADDTCPVA